MSDPMTDQFPPGNSAEAAAATERRLVASRPSPGGVRGLGSGVASNTMGRLPAAFNAGVREGIVEVSFGCQSVTLFPGTGAVEINSGVLPNEWQRVTPEAAETLGKVLIQLAAKSRERGKGER